jgi:hypothetical protein
MREPKLAKRVKQFCGPILRNSAPTSSSGRSLSSPCFTSNRCRSLHAELTLEPTEQHGHRPRNVPEPVTGAVDDPQVASRWRRPGRERRGRAIGVGSDRRLHRRPPAHDDVDDWCAAGLMESRNWILMLLSRRRTDDGRGKPQYQALGPTICAGRRLLAWWRRVGRTGRGPRRVARALKRWVRTFVRRERSHSRGPGFVHAARAMTAVPAPPVPAAPPVAGRGGGRGGCRCRRRRVRRRPRRW